MFLLSATLALHPALAQFRAAAAGYKYEFPRDHFNHPDYQTEWWYYTGNLTAADGACVWLRADFLPRGREPTDEGNRGGDGCGGLGGE